MATRNLLVRAGFDASGMSRGTRQANNALRQFGQNANRQMSSLSNTISSSMGKIGKLLAGAFAIGAIVNFGKECVELGSDLSEVQNVVDVTFGSMAEDVNQFAKAAITQLGLSETSAKQYTSTMGAMLKSMGLTTSQALTMSKTITSLSADMASFYNLSSDDAFEKIRSGISGETEPLKQLGINMSVANMEAYAMAQGISKAYSKMTQQEQTLLRYNYLLSVTADAQGDFARTSDSWANQTRILAEQFNALKAEIGQGLIAALTPVVRALNVVINKLRVAAGYFRAFMELIFGKQSASGGSGMSDVADATDSIANSAGGASDAVEGVGDAAQKAGKKAKGALASFDELNQLNLSSNSGDSGSNGSGGTGLEDMGGAVEVDFGEVEEGTTKLDGLLDGLIEEVTRLKDLFATGFKWGLGEDFDKKIADIKNSIQGIKDSLVDLFTDSEVVNSSKNLLDSIVLNAGKITGSMISIGTTIAQNLLGGINKYLDQNKQYIKDRLVGIMDASSEIADLVGNFAVAFADIFSVFGGETAQQVTANIIAILGNAFLGSLELALKFGRDIIQVLVDAVVNNKDKFKQAIEGTLEVFESFSGTVANAVTNTFNKAIEVYDTYISPAYDKMSKGFSKIVGAILDCYNTYIQPTLMSWGEDYNKLYQEHLKPFIDAFLEGFGKLINLASDVYTNFVAPISSWLITVLAPAFAEAFDIIWTACVKLVEWLADCFKDIVVALTGVIDFLDGVFTGDWNKAWEGIKEIVSGVVELIYDLTIGALTKIVEWLSDSFINSWNAAVESIKNFFSPLAEWFNTTVTEPIKQFFSGLWEVIKTTASECWNGLVSTWQEASTWFNTTIIEPIKRFFTDLWEVIKEKASEAWNGIVSVWNAAGTWFSTTIIEPIKNKFSEWSTNVKQLATDAWNGLKNTWNSAKQWFSSTVIDPIAKAFDTMWNGVKSTCTSVFNGIKDAVRTPLNYVIDMINKVIGGLNNLSIDVPDWIPGIGGSTWGVNIPKVPRLARGGIVDGATFMGNYIAGEAGKEMIVPLENTSFTDKIASAMGQAVMNSMSVMLNGNSGTGNTQQNVVLEWDGVAFARTAAPYMIKEMRRLGIEL